MPALEELSLRERSLNRRFRSVPAFPALDAAIDGRNFINLADLGDSEFKFGPASLIGRYESNALP